MNSLATRVIQGPEHGHAVGVTACHQGRPTGRAHTGRDIEVRETPALPGQAIEVGCLEPRHQTAHITVALIIGLSIRTMLGAAVSAADRGGGRNTPSALELA